VAAVACALAAAGAAALAFTLAVPTTAAAGESAGGVLSPRLAELAKPSLRSAPPAEQARELGLTPRGPGSLLREGNRVLVDVRFERRAAAGAAALRATGAKVLNVSGRYQTITVAAKPAELRALAAVPGAVGAKEVLMPMVAEAGPGGPVASLVTPCFGAATSEGDQQLRAAEARNAFGVDGSGVTVGILSDSFDADEFAVAGAGDDVKSGDLPGPGNPCGHADEVNVLEEIEEAEEGADEGRAMAQIVHDLAPGAALAFASAFNGEFQFAENIERLAEPVAAEGAEAQVIADDVFYLDEPFFQDGPVAVAANKVASEGVAYFSAAGNDNLIDEEGNDIASWEAPEFRDAGPCPAGVPFYAAHCMDFDPQAGVENVDTGFRITVEPEATLIVDLQWAQPWFGVTTDLDAYLLRNGEVVEAGEQPNVHPALQEPVEVLGWENPSESSRTVTLAIDRCDLTCGTARAAANPELSGTVGGDTGTPRLKFALLENGSGVSSTEYPKSSEGDVVGPTIFGHAGAAGAVGVGAIPYFSESAPEPYSSRGPVKHYFGPVEGNTPAAELGSAETLAKPDLVATDGGANTFFGSCVGHVWRFFGTSAAAPHAAAVAALEMSAETSPSAAEAIEAQEETARKLPPFGVDAVGSGIVDAFGAVGQVLGSSGKEEEVSGPGFPPPDCSEEPSGPPIKEIEEKIIAANPPAATSPPTGRKIPSTFFRRHPRRLIRTPERRATAVFRFGSDEADVTFFCRVDGGFLRVCPERFVRRYAEGPHVVRVMARNAAGGIDSTPAVFRFKVKRSG
jgi:subtilisin family serine protease